MSPDNSAVHQYVIEITAKAEIRSPDPLTEDQLKRIGREIGRGRTPWQGVPTTATGRPIGDIDVDVVAGESPAGTPKEES